MWYHAKYNVISQLCYFPSMSYSATSIVIVTCVYHPHLCHPCHSSLSLPLSLSPPPALSLFLLSLCLSFSCQLFPLFPLSCCFSSPVFIFFFLSHTHLFSPPSLCVCFCHYSLFLHLSSQSALASSGGLYCLHGCAVNISALHCMGLAE